MAFLWLALILGGKKPCVVELASNTADELAAEEAPTITFPLFIIAPVLKFAILPTLVKLEPVIVEFKVVPKAKEVTPY